MTEQNVRPELVEAAEEFFSYPKVKQTSLEKQKQFLLKNGVNEAEIQEALRARHAVNASAANSSRVPLPSQPEYQSLAPATAMRNPKQFLLVAKLFLIFSGLSFVGYRFFRSHILRFFKSRTIDNSCIQHLQSQMNELQNSIKYVMDSVMQSLRLLGEQHEKFSRCVSTADFKDNQEKLKNLQADVSIIKSFMMDRYRAPLTLNGSLLHLEKPSVGDGVASQPSYVTMDEQ